MCAPQLQAILAAGWHRTLTHAASSRDERLLAATMAGGILLALVWRRCAPASYAKVRAAATRAPSATNPSKCRGIHHAADPPLGCPSHPPPLQHYAPLHCALRLGCVQPGRFRMDARFLSDFRPCGAAGACDGAPAMLRAAVVVVFASGIHSSLLSWLLPASLG